MTASVIVLLGLGSGGALIVGGIRGLSKPITCEVHVMASEDTCRIVRPDGHTDTERGYDPQHLPQRGGEAIVICVGALIAGAAVGLVVMRSRE